MQADRYYDWRRNRPLTAGDGCSMAEWLAGGHERFSFAVHPNGFAVFLLPQDLAAMDGCSLDPMAVKRSEMHHRPKFKTIRDLVQRALGPDTVRPRLLDIGCGGGHITAFVGQGIPQATLSALDCSLRAIECAVGLYPGIDFVVADAHNLPYPPQSFDGVISCNMWEHLPDPVRFLEAVRRVLKPRGFLVLSTPSRYRLFNLLRVVRGRPVALKSPNHVTEYTVGQVKEQLTFGGFKVQQVDGRITSSALGGIREFVGFGLIAPWLRLWIKVTGSHHCLGDPAFFLARKVRD